MKTYPGLADVRAEEEEEYTKFPEAVDAAWERVHLMLSSENVSEEDCLNHTAILRTTLQY